jgi:flagellar assembly protein FliH
MMSSSNRIKKEQIVRSKKKVWVNDSYAGNPKEVTDKEIEEYRKKMLDQINQKQNELEKALRENEERFIQGAYETGFEKAKNEVKEEIRQTCEAQIKEAELIYKKANEYYRSIQRQVEIENENRLKENEATILDYAALYSMYLLEKEMQADPDLYKDMLEKTLKTIKDDSRKIYIYVHPEKAKLLQTLENDRFILLSDLSLDPTDVVIETDKEFIDASLKTQINEIKLAVKGERI